jgi:hypothetical protein
MAWHRFIGISFAGALASVAAAQDSPMLDALRARYPQGIPWRVEIVDANKASLGALEMRITSEPGSSCLGDVGNGGVKVEFVRKDGLSPALHTSSYGVAKFSGNKVKIDLTGGLCDAYLLMEGVMAADGSSSGDVFTLSLGGGHDVGTFRASVR